MDKPTRLNDSPTERRLISDALPTPTYANPPDWLLQAVSSPTSSHFIECAGTRLHYRCWNAMATHKPTLLFVHGYKAHSHWWDFIAPYFIEHFRVIAMDFSGMGRSGHRSSYTRDTFTADLVGLLDSVIGPATVVGHSYGGMQTLRACAERPELIPHAIILDSWVRFLDVDSSPIADLPLGHHNQSFANYSTIRKRYRVLPDQPVPLPDILEHVAFHSIKEGADGWRWRFDPALPNTRSVTDGDSLLGRIDVAVDYVYGEHSGVVERWRAERIAAQLRHCPGAICIPQSHHHLMLDQPLALVGVLRALLLQRSSGCSAKQSAHPSGRIAD